MPRTALIDGDILAYRCGFAAEHKKYTLKFTESSEQKVWHSKEFDGKLALNAYLKEHAEDIAEHEWTSELEVEPLKFCLATVKHMIANVTKATRSDKAEIYLSSETNFRNDIATVLKYKGNRDQRRRPLHHAEIVRYIKKYYNAITLRNMEADDVLADVQTSRNKAGQDTVIVSIDKDLLQIPGKHYNFVKEEFLNVSEETAMRNFYVQMLTGDRVDNIPGIKGLGPVKAEKLLEDCTTELEYWDVVYVAWDAYLSSDDTPDWVDHYNEGTKDILYATWTDGGGFDVVYKETTLIGFLDELESLLRVGIPDGKSEEDGT